MEMERGRGSGSSRTACIECVDIYVQWTVSGAPGPRGPTAVIRVVGAPRVGLGTRLVSRTTEETIVSAKELRTNRAISSLAVSVSTTNQETNYLSPKYKQSQITLYQIAIDIIRNNSISENGKAKKT